MSALILVVDDEPLTVNLLTRFLQHEGYRVVTAADGLQALERVRQEAPDLILLDVTMPRMDGFTACEILKKDDHTALIPITMLTGQDDPDHHRRGIEAGADDFLSKPFDLIILRARIRAQLNIKRLTDQLEHTESVIFMLAQAVEANDSYTEAHLHRISGYGEQVALAAGLNHEDVRAVRLGGILHDIGKIGIPDSILRKPGKLTEDEMDVMRKHPAIGAQIISQMRFATRVVPIVLGHHERWDGRGYPHSLAGENIPIGARIICIVDAFDAMTTTRPYREAMPIARALDQLREGRGAQFDPDLTDLFIGLVERNELRVPDHGHDQVIFGAAVLQRSDVS
jgi:putative two-component system response regulator